MNISSIKISSSAENIPIEQMAKNPTVSEADKVKEVSRQFESYLLRQYLGEARKPLVESKCNLNASGSQIYRDMVTSQLADSISKSGGLGLGTTLAEQLTRQNLQQSAPAAGGEVATATTKAKTK